jgi:hypothetical protein
MSKRNTHQIGNALHAVFEATVRALIDMRPSLTTLTLELFCRKRQGDVDAVFIMSEIAAADSPKDTSSSSVPQILSNASITPGSPRMSHANCSCPTPYRLNSPPLRCQRDRANHMYRWKGGSWSICQVDGSFPLKPLSKPSSQLYIRSTYCLARSAGIAPLTTVYC